MTTMLVMGLTLFCVATAGLGVISLERAREARAVEGQRDAKSSAMLLEVVALSKQIQLDVVQVQQFLTDVSATRAQDGLNDGWEEAAKNAKAFEVDVARARELAKALDAPDLDAALTNLAGEFPDYYRNGQTMAHAYVDGGTSAGNAHMAAFDSAAETLTSRMDATKAALALMQKRQDVKDAAIEARLRASQLTSEILCGLMALGGCVIGAVVVLQIRGRLLQPLAQIGAYMGRLATGNYDETPPYGDREDELGAMSKSIEVFREAAIERRTSRLEQEARREAAERERLESEAERAERASVARVKGG
jgi:methyl-accepting chemotaxis protein